MTQGVFELERRRRHRTVRPLTAVLAAAVALALVVAAALGAVVFTSRSRSSAAALDPTAFAFMRTRPGHPSVPITWDPCLPIEILVNNDAAPPGADQLLDEAIQRVNTASGLRLHVIGTTHLIPDPNPTVASVMRGQPGGVHAPVLLAWTTPSAAPGLAGRVTGRGGPITMPAHYADQGRFVGGTVVLDTPDMAGILRHLNGHAEARAVVMHELGHLVGLQHVDNPHEIMAPTAHLGVTEFAPGDLAGLRKLGSGGCPYDAG